MCFRRVDVSASCSVSYAFDSKIVDLYMYAPDLFYWSYSDAFDSKTVDLFQTFDLKTVDLYILVSGLVAVAIAVVAMDLYSHTLDPKTVDLYINSSVSDNPYKLVCVCVCW